MKYFRGLGRYSESCSIRQRVVENLAVRGSQSSKLVEVYELRIAFYEYKRTAHGLDRHEPQW